MIAQLSIVGLGLIGGSIAAGAKKFGLAERVVAVDRRPEELDAGIELGYVDAVSAGINDEVLASDMIVVAVPVLSMGGVFDQLAAAGGIITDVGSVKAPVIEAARTSLGQLKRFVPGHPIAGSERHGARAARFDLFTDRKLILTPVDETEAGAVAAVEALWAGLGADVIGMSADHHDDVLAQTSHLPHLLAYALVDLLSQQGDSLEIFKYAAGGFRDFSRIAASDPIMWRDVFRSNRGELLRILDKYMDELDMIRERLTNDDWDAVEVMLTRAKAARDHFSELEAGKS